MRLVDLLQVAKEKFQESTNDNLQASSSQMNTLQFNSIERKSLLLANPTIWLCENCKDTNLESLDIGSRNPMQQYEAILDETALVTIAIQATHEDDIGMKSIETKGISEFLDELKTMTTENVDNSISSAVYKEMNVVSTSDVTSIVNNKQDVLIDSEPVFAEVKSQEPLSSGVSTENVIATSSTTSYVSTATITPVETSDEEERLHRPSPRYHSTVASQPDDKHENIDIHNLYKRLQLSHLPVHQNPTTTTATPTTTTAAIFAPPSAQTFHQHTSAQAPVKTPLQVSTPTQWAVEFLRENEAAATAVAASLLALLLVYVFHTVSDRCAAYKWRRQQQRQKEQQQQRQKERHKWDKQANESEHDESAEWEEADSTDHNQPQPPPAQHAVAQQSKRSSSNNVTVPEVSMNFSKEYSAQEEERIPEGGNIYPHMVQRSSVGVTKAAKHINKHVPFAKDSRQGATQAAIFEGDSENAHLTESDLRQDEAQNHAILHNTLAVSTDFDGIMARSHDHNNARSLHMHQLRQLSQQNINISVAVKTQLAVQEAVLLCDDITSSVSDPMYYFDAPEEDNESANMVAMLESVRRNNNKTTTASNNVTPFVAKSNVSSTTSDETQTPETPASAVLDMSVIYTHHNNSNSNSINSKRSNESTPRFSEVNPLFSPAVLTSAAHNAPTTPIIATTMSTRKVTTTSVSDYSSGSGSGSIVSGKKSVAAVWAEQEEMERRLSQQNNQMYYGDQGGQLEDGDTGSGAVSDYVKGGIRGILSGNSSTTGSVIHSADYYHNTSHDVHNTDHNNDHNNDATNTATYTSAAITTLSNSSSDSNHDKDNDIMYTYSTDTNTYTIDTHTIDTHAIDNYSVYDTFSTFNTETTVFVDLNDLPLEQHEQNNFDHNPDHTDSESLLTAVSQLPVAAPRKSRSNEKLEPFAHLLSESCSIFDELRYFEEHCLVEEQGEQGQHDMGDFSIGCNSNMQTADDAPAGKTAVQTMNRSSNSANTAVSVTHSLDHQQHITRQHNTVRMLQMVYTLNSLSSSGESEPKSVLDYAVLLDKHNCGESVEPSNNSSHNSIATRQSEHYIPPYQQYNSHSNSKNNSPIKHTQVHHNNISSTDNVHPQQQPQQQQHGRKRSVSDNSRFNTSNTPKRAVPAGAIVATSPPEDTDVTEVAGDVTPYGVIELDITVDVADADVDSAAAMQTTTVPHVISTSDSIGDIHSSSSGSSDSSDLVNSTIFHKIMTSTTASADDDRASSGTSISDLFHAQFNSEFVQLGGINSADINNGDISGDNDNNINNLLSGIGSTYSSPERVRFEQLYTIREGSCDSGDHSPNLSPDRSPEPLADLSELDIKSHVVVAEVEVAVSEDTTTETETGTVRNIVTPSPPDNTLPVLPSNAIDVSYMRDILSTNDQLQQALNVLSSPVRRARAKDAVETDTDSTLLMHTPPAKTVDTGTSDGIFTPTPTATPTASISIVAAATAVEQNNTSNSSNKSSVFHDNSLPTALPTEPTSPAAVSHHSNRRKKQGVVLRSPPDTVDKRLLARARDKAADRGVESLDPVENSIGDSIHSTGGVNLSGLLRTPPPKSQSGSCSNSSINSGSSVVDRILEIAAVHSPQHSVNNSTNGREGNDTSHPQVFTSPPIKSSGVYNWEAQQQAIEAQRGPYFRPHPLSSLALGGGTDDTDDISVLTCEFDNIATSTPDAQPATPLETTAATATQQQTPTQTAEQLQLQQLKELHVKCSQFIFQLAQFQRRETDAQFEREQQLEMLNESGNDLLYAVNYSSPSAEGDVIKVDSSRNGSSGSSGGASDSLLQAEILFSSLLLDHLSEKREETETLVSHLLGAIHSLNSTNSNNSVHINNINSNHNIDNNASPATVLSTASSITNNKFDLLALSIATPAATAPSPHPSTLVQMDAEYVDARVEELRQSLEALLSTHNCSTVNSNNNSNNIEKSDTTPRTKHHHNNNDTAGYHTAAEGEEQEGIGSDEDGDDSVASSVEPYVFTLESTQNNLNRNLNLELLAAEHQHAHNGKNNNAANSAISSSGSHSFSFTLPPSSTRKTTLEVSSDYYSNSNSLHSPQRQYNTSGTVSGGSNISTPNKQSSSSNIYGNTNGNGSNINGISNSNSNSNSNSKSKQLHRPQSLHNLISSNTATSPIKNAYNNDIHPMQLRSPDSNKSSKSSNSAAVQTSSPTRGQGGRNPVNSFDVRLVSPRSANQQQQYQQIGHISSPHSAHSPKSESSAYTTPQSSPQVRSSASDTRSYTQLSKNGKNSASSINISSQPSIHDIGYVLSTRKSYDHDLYSQLATSSSVLSVHSSPAKPSNSANNSNKYEPTTPPASRSSGMFVSSSITAHKSPPAQSHNSNGIVYNSGGNTNITTPVNKTSNISGAASSSYSRSRSAARRQNKARSSGTPSSGVSVPLVQLTPESFTTPTKQSHKPLDTPTEF